MTLWRAVGWAWLLAAGAQGVAGAQPTLAPSPAVACLAAAPGSPPLLYPPELLRRKDGGTVKVELRFAAADQAPKVNVLAAPRHTTLVAEVRDFAAGLRMPCLGSQPVEQTQLFMFKIDGGARTVLNDFSLVQLVGAARDLPAGVYFDLNTMQCPFSLRLGYFRPHGPNEVRALDTHHPARQAFMDWLSQITLNLPDVRNTEVLGQTITVEVPCGTVDL